MVGHLHFLWWWAVDYAEDGDLSQYDAFDVADAAGWDGDPDTFIDALVVCGPGEDSGFLDADKHLHDWSDYAGKLISQREANRERQRRFRKKKAAKRDEPSLEKARNGNVTRDTPVSNGATVPNLTKPNQEESSARAREEEPPAITEESTELTTAEQYISARVREIRGMANVPAVDVVLHVRECLDNRGSPLAEFTLRSEFQKFRDYWQERRSNQPANKKWTGWKRAMTNWMSKIPDEPEDAMSTLDALYPVWTGGGK